MHPDWMDGLDKIEGNIFSGTGKGWYGNGASGYYEYGGSGDGSTDSSGSENERSVYPEDSLEEINIYANDWL